LLLLSLLLPLLNGQPFPSLIKGKWWGGERLPRYLLLLLLPLLLLLLLLSK
jgi:hypothetical protein